MFEVFGGFVGGGAVKLVNTVTKGLPAVLRGGDKIVSVYYGVRNAERVYVGITNNMLKRQAGHGDRFVLERVALPFVTRGEALAIEQALKNRNSFENIRNPISPDHPWYQQAVDWAEEFLKSYGF